MAVANVLWQFATNCGVLPKGAMAAGGLRREVREITVAGREGLSRHQTAKTWAEGERDLHREAQHEGPFSHRGPAKVNVSVSRVQKLPNNFIFFLTSRREGVIIVSS